MYDTNGMFLLKSKQKYINYKYKLIELLQSVICIIKSGSLLLESISEAFFYLKDKLQ